MNSDNSTDNIQPNSNSKNPFNYSFTGAVESEKKESVVNHFQSRGTKKNAPLRPTRAQDKVYAKPQSRPAPRPVTGTKSNKAKTKKAKRVVGVGFLFTFLLFALLTSLLVGGLGLYGGYYLAKQELSNDSENVKTVTRLVTEVNVAEENSDTVEVVANNLNAVVSIVATQEFSIDSEIGSDLGDPSTTQTQRVSAGTGFFIRDDGFGITNRHVVENKELDYVAVLFDGRSLPVNIIARDDVIDIAFFEVIEPEETFPIIEIGSSKEIQPGQSVVAIGYSLGAFSNTVSKGIVSGLDRSITAQGANGSETLEGVIQTDASINSGNSGGPLLDLDGNVVGVNVARAGGGENIGFAIPVDSVRPLLNSVLETGKIVHPFLGIRYRSLNPAFSEQFDLEPSFGAYIISSEPDVPPLVEGAPAERAGVKVEDVIVGINDEKITATKSLQSLLRTYQAGEEVTLNISRNGETINIPVTLGERTVEQ